MLCLGVSSQPRGSLYAVFSLQASDPALREVPSFSKMCYIALMVVPESLLGLLLSRVTLRRGKGPIPPDPRPGVGKEG